MARTKKTVKTEELTPQVLVTRQQYVDDIKARWAIHKYEVAKLTEDLKKLNNIVSPWISQTVEYVKETYQREFVKKTV
jgi:hypothetical protein